MLVTYLRCRYWRQQARVPAGYEEDYVATGDPNGLEPAVPTIARRC